MLPHFGSLWNSTFSWKRYRVMQNPIFMLFSQKVAAKMFSSLVTNIVVLAIICIFMYSAEAKNIYSTDSFYRSSVLASHQRQSQVNNVALNQGKIKPYKVNRDVSFPVFQGQPLTPIIKLNSKIRSNTYDPEEFRRVVNDVPESCFRQCTPNKHEWFKCQNYYDIEDFEDVRIYACCLYPEDPDCGEGNVDLLPEEYLSRPCDSYDCTLSQPAENTTEDVITNDMQELGLYFLRKDKRHKRGPQDFLSFTFNNSYMLNLIVANAKFTVLVHGFSPFVDDPKYGYDVFDEQNLLDIAYEYFRRGKFVLLLDWTKYSTQVSMEYHMAASNVEFAGRRARQLFMELGYFDADKVHCVGYGLGAHVCGWFGFNQRTSAPIISRIDGIAPTVPLFGLNETYSSKHVVARDSSFTVLHHCLPFDEVASAKGLFRGGHAYFVYTKLCQQCTQSFSEGFTPFFSTCDTSTRSKCINGKKVLTNECITRNCVKEFYRSLYYNFHAQYVDENNNEETQHGNFDCHFGPHAEPSMRGTFSYYDSCGRCYLQL